MSNIDYTALADRLADPPTDYQTKHGLTAPEMMVWHVSCVEGADALRHADERIAELERCAAWANRFKPGSASRNAALEALHALVLNKDLLK